VRPDQARRKLRALVSMYADDSRRFLNLYGPQGTIDTIDLTEVLATLHTAASPDPLGLRGKVLFVGFADERAGSPWRSFPPHSEEMAAG
jgi:hypothetical protein